MKRKPLLAKLGPCFTSKETDDGEIVRYELKDEKASSRRAEGCEHAAILRRV